MKQHSLQNGQGALYLIDHIGRPPKGVDFRTFTNQAIVDHLQQHSYRYERKNNTTDLALADPAWMRKYFGSLEDKVKKFDKSYTPDARGRDPADRLFRKGTTKDFPAEVLKAFNYDRAKFSESDLPIYTNQSDGEATGSEATKKVQAPTRTRGMQKVDEHDAADSSRRKIETAKPSKVSAKHVSSPMIRNSDASFEITENEDEGETETENDEDIGQEEGNGHLNSNKDDGNNAGDHSTVRHPKDSTESPDQIQVLVVGAKKPSSKLKLRRPRRVPNSQERSSGSAFVSSTAEAGEANRTINDAERLTAENQTSSQINGRSETVANAPDSVSRGKSQKLSGQSNRSSVLNNAMAEHPQRQLGGNEGATQANSDTDELPINLKKRKASDAVGSLPNGRAKRRSHIPNAPANVASPPSRSKPDVPAPIPSPITPREERNDVQAASSDPKAAHSPQDGLTTSAIDHQNQHAQVSIAASARNNNDLYTRLERATDRIIARIGKISERLSPLAKNPTERLEALYVRCWGPEWKAVKSRLTEDNLFVVSEVVMSVIAGFMFDNVLNQQTSLEDIEKMLLGVNGTMGRTVVRALKFQMREHDFARLARALEVKDARALFDQGNPSVTAHLRSEAQKLTKELWDIIEPHFDSLSTLAQLYDLSSTPNNERSLQDVFEEQITAIIEAALLYRLKLLASRRNHVHIWPKTDDAYDVAVMEILGAQEARKELQVLFTVFPGTKLAKPGSGDLEAEQKTQATVKVKLLAREI